MSASYRWIHRVWYEDAKSGLILLPLSGIYYLLLKLRAQLYRFGMFRTFAAHAPVIVVGNITAGGTGKTRLALQAAADQLDRFTVAAN